MQKGEVIGEVRMLTGFRSRILFAFAAIATSASSLSAQTTFEVGPVAGYYRPTGHFERASVYSTSLPLTPADLSGFAWGGEARVWFGRRLGVQTQGIVAPSTFPQIRVALGLTTMLYMLDIPMPQDLRLNPGSIERGFQREVLLHLGVTWGR